MSQDLSASAKASGVAVTLTTAAQAERIYLPRWCGVVYVQPKAASADIAYSGAEGAALTNGVTILSGDALPFPVVDPRSSTSLPSIYLAPSVNGQVVTLQLIPGPMILGG